MLDTISLYYSSHLCRRKAAETLFAGGTAHPENHTFSFKFLEKEMSWYLLPSLEVGVCQSSRVGGGLRLLCGWADPQGPASKSKATPPVRAQGHPLTGPAAGLSPAPAKREMGATTFQLPKALHGADVAAQPRNPQSLHQFRGKAEPGPWPSAPRSSSNLTPNPSDGKSPRSGSTDEKDGQDGRAGPGHRVVTRL